LALLPTESYLLAGSSPDIAVHRAGIDALAGDPNAVLGQAGAVVEEIERYSDVMWKGEYLLILGIALSRCGRWTEAVGCIELAKRTPMSHPFWYALARRHGRPARARLDEINAKKAIDNARSLTVDQALHRDFG
jgi:hypothetical protein